MNATPPGYVHLQGIGPVAGKKLRDLKPGDLIMWNYGYTSTLLECAPVTKKMWKLKTRSNQSGLEGERRKRPDTLVACAINGKFRILM